MAGESAPPAGAQGARQLTDAQKDDLALQLRLSHHSYEQIGTALGCTAQNAYRRVAKLIKRGEKARAKDAAILVEMEVSRCEEVEKALWPNRGKPGHALALAAWTDRRHRLLGFKGEPPPPIDRTQLKAAIAEALGIQVEPKALPASQRIVEVAADGQVPPAEAAEPEAQVHARRMG